MSYFSGHLIHCKDNQCDPINCGDTGVIKIIDTCIANSVLCASDGIKTDTCMQKVKQYLVELCDSKPTCEPVEIYRKHYCQWINNHLRVQYHCVTTGNYIFTYIIV